MRSSTTGSSQARLVGRRQSQYLDTEKYELLVVRLQTSSRLTVGGMRETAQILDLFDGTGTRLLAAAPPAVGQASWASGEGIGPSTTPLR